MSDKQMKVIDLSPAQQANAQTAIQALDNQPVTVEQMICRGIDRGLPVDTMERLLAMRRELKAEQAKEAFNCAMAQFQAECPEIKKTKAVIHQEKVRYRYAPLECIIEQVKESLARNGFSHKEDAIVEPGWVTGICKVTHTGGHSEQTTFKVPIDPKAFMNEAQKFASAFTFTKRYAFCAAFGIMTADEDDDSQGSSDPKPPHPPAAAQRIEHPRNQAPSKPAPVTAQQQARPVVPEGEGLYPVCSILGVTEHPGKSKSTGKPYVKYNITFHDGFSDLAAETFDRGVADLANTIANDSAKARIQTKPGFRPGTMDIVTLNRALDDAKPRAASDTEELPMEFDERGNPVDIIP